MTESMTGRTALTNRIHPSTSRFCNMKHAPCELRGCKNRPAPFPGRMSYKATKPGLVSVLYLSIHYMVSLFISALFMYCLSFSGRITVGRGQPERPGGPRKTSVLRGFKGACKSPPPLKLQDDHPSIRHCIIMSF